MALETVFSLLLISGVLQGLVQAQQTDENQQGVIVSYGNYLRPRSGQVQAFLDDGEEIQGGFTPLAALGPPEYALPRFQLDKRPPQKKPQQPNRLRPKAYAPGIPDYRFDNYDQPIRQHSPPHQYLYNQFY